LGINIVKGRNRNHPCPCGSGHKYKKCCGAFSAIQNPDPTIPYREIPPEVQQAFIQHQVREAERIRKFGHVGPIIAADHQGYKFVAVGNRLHYSKSWKTFHDFLWEYIAAVVTKEWGDAELKKPFAERHPIAQWYHHLCDFQRMAAREEPGGIYSAIATGSVMAYTALAYDLYTLAHHTLLQAKLVRRLQNRDQFQGARYEIYVSAAFVRAGFDVKLEDESDSTTTHCEFTATHQATGLYYSVEAKSRHRPGFLGQPGTPQPLEEIETDVYRLLQKALRKQAAYDRIIFIDVNVPPQVGTIFETDWFRKVATQIMRLEESQSAANPWPPAFVFFTNHPYHYVGNDQTEPGKSSIFTAINMPDFKQPNPAVLGKYPAIAQLLDSVINHTVVPHEF